MPKEKKSPQGAPDEISALKKRLAEPEETLQAIRQYLVDAFVVQHAGSDEVVTTGGCEFPLPSRMVESMNEGAATLIPDGSIFYCQSLLWQHSWDGV